MPAPTVCGLCNAQPSKYKCPKCLVPYCSLACYKPHKIAHESDPEPAPAAAAPPPIPEKSQPQEHRFAILKSDPQLQHMLKSPTLRMHAEKVLRAMMAPEPEYDKMGYEVRSKWTEEMGKKRGMAVLRRLRIHGIEENVEVEEFVRRIVELVGPQGDEW